VRLHLAGGEPRAIFPDDSVSYDAEFLSPHDADAALAAVAVEVAWRQEHMRMFGRAVALPRLTAWYGEPGAAYVYSGILNAPQALTPALQALRARVEAAAGARFNSVLVNRYRGGDDAMGWHADDEPELGAVIASLSLGAARRFHFRENATRRRTDLVLEHGSLLVMRGATQHVRQHRVPRTTMPCGERINLTFREVAVR
jgi:alkylated DNA repair dioxygenase AlkB